MTLGQQILQQLINGISLGSVYALIALGYTMVYGIIRLINFAHGEVFMIGAFVGYFIITLFKLPFILALIFAMIFCALLGIFMERLAYKPLRDAPRIAALMTAVGLSIFFQNLMVYLKWIGASPKAFPRVIEITRFEVIENVYLTSDKILTLGVALVLMLALQYVVHKTKMGKAMRAVSQDKDAAQLMGINVDSTISFTFALGSALAAAGGILYAVSYGKIIYNMGTMPGLKAFVSAVLGGIGSIPGAVAGGMLLGITENAVSAAGMSMLRDAVAFAILILILLIKPTGIFGKNTREKV
ncbi:MAG: branched-chain amino acid ABC transporter permease [Firmicutes bacterium]|nr:branched-chain amino acid ABC transporter permease [Bacillota bacterium]